MRNSSLTSVDRAPGSNEISALPVVEHLYRLLILKYNAYFGSTSPTYPKKGQPPTTEVLAGDEHLKREWDNVSVRRKEFCKHPNAMNLGSSQNR